MMYMSWRLISLLSGIILCLNMSFWHQPSWGVVLGVIYLWSLIKLQARYYYNFSCREAYLLAGLKIILILSVVGAIAFYLNIFRTWFIGLFIISLPLFKIPKIKTWQPIIKEEVNPWLFAFFVIGLGLTWHYLALAQTQNAIRTPWQVIPPIVLGLYLATAFITIRLAYQKTTPWLLIPFYFLTWSVINLIYPLAFGFDSFIHQASEKIISLTGTLDPKPWYYLGQYSLVVSLEKITLLPLKLIDQWLVPVLASLFLPFQFNKLAKKITFHKPWPWLLTLLPLILTLPFFTYTTPQALANLWALIAVLEISFNIINHHHKLNKTLILLTLATLLTHPLTGLPLLGVISLYYFIFIYQGEQKKAYQYISAAIIALAVPAAFVALSLVQNSGTSLTINIDILGRLQILGDNIKNSLPIWPRYIDLVDLTYLWSKLLPLISFSLVALAITKFKSIHHNLNFFVLIFALTTTGYLLLFIFARFTNLTPNEQFFYTTRLWDLSKLWLWPLLIYGGYYFGQLIPQIFQRPVLVILGGALLLTAGFYLSYPRLDLYNKDTAYNTTPDDLTAVTSIVNNALDDYIVLANQAVAAAAIDLYGFNKYYQGNFYYPVPTGTNPLYQIYLEASERNIPTRDIIKKASDIAGVKVVYLVLNQYWSGFDKLTAVADTEANDKWEINNTKVKIYKYQF